MTPIRPYHLVRLALLWAAGATATMALAQQSCPVGLSLSTPDSDFADAGAGMVQHKPTGLVWKRCAEGQAWDGVTCTGMAATYTWQQAFARADAVNTNAAGTQNLGATDWRLPNVNELKSLVEMGCTSPSINLTQFPNISAWLFWSGSPIAGVPGDAWGVYFGNGVDGWLNRSDAYHLRLVRAGQSFLNFDAAATAPTLAGTAPGGTVGQPYPGFAPALGPAGVTQPVAYALATGSLPPGLALDPATGAISGTPTQAGSYSLTLIASNVGGGSAPLALNVVIAAAPVAPVISGSAPNGAVGQAYAGFVPTLGPAGVAQPVTYALGTGSLPPGLALNPATGAISGTPTQAGTYSFTLVANNAGGNSAPLALSIGVAPAAAAAVAPVPTLGEWGLMLLGLLAAGLGVRRLRQ